MAPHFSTLAWKIPWMEEPGRLQSMGSLRAGHDWATLLSLFTFMHWRRKWQPTPVFLPGESQGWGSLAGCHLWGRTESDTTEVTQQLTVFWCESCLVTLLNQWSPTYGRRVPISRPSSLSCLANSFPKVGSCLKNPAEILSCVLIIRQGVRVPPFRGKMVLRVWM